MIGLGEWTPDQPDYRGPGLTTATNILPREDGAYGPFGSLTAFSGALPTACLGLGAGKSNAGDYLTFAGTATRLYRLLSDNTWSDVSNPTLYSLTGDDRWQFAVFGNTFVAAGGVDEDMQSYDLTSSTQFAGLSGTAPRARYIAVIGNFLMAANTWDGSDGYLRNRVWWSGIGNAASWPTPGSDAAATVQSGRAELRDGGDIMGIVPGVLGADGAIFGESRIWRVNYNGPPTVFQFDVLERSRGVYAAGSIASVDGKAVIFLNEDGWYMLDGDRARPIGAGKIDRWFLNDLDDSARARMWSASIPDRKVILWAYPGVGSPSGLCNRILAYNWVSDRWTVVEQTTEMIGNARSPGYTLEALDSLGFTLDELPFSLDSRVWAGGGPIVGIFNSSHVLCQASGDNLEANLKTNEFSGPVGAARMFVSGVLPYTDADGITAAIDVKHSEFDTATTSSFRSPGADRIVPLRHPARRASIRFRVNAGETWNVIQGYDLKAKPEGYR